MLDLTRQEKTALIFLMVSALLGTGILCFKRLMYQPKIEIVSRQLISERSAKNTILDLNKATQNELVRLRGIGPYLAQAIVEYRTQFGDFTNKEEVKNVKGIGQATYDQIKEYITVE